MDSRVTVTVRAKVAAAHKLLDPLAGAAYAAMSELDDAIGLTSDSVDSAESYADNLELTASTAAERVQARSARSRVEALEELRNKLEELHSAAEQAHTYLDETGGLHDASAEALDEIPTT